MPKDKKAYQRISEALLTDIQNNRFCEHTKLPSERELIERFSVSRMTVRNALDELIARGILYRIDGRGTFVAPKQFYRTQSIKSFTQLMEESGYHVSSRVVCFEECAADEDTAAKLALSTGDCVYHLERIRYADQIPVAYEALYVPACRFPDLISCDVEAASLYEIYQKCYHHRFQYNQESVKAMEVRGSIAQALYQKKKGFVLAVQGTLFNTKQEAIECGISYYHHEHYIYRNVSYMKEL